MTPKVPFDILEKKSFKDFFDYLVTVKLYTYTEWYFPYTDQLMEIMEQGMCDIFKEDNRILIYNHVLEGLGDKLMDRIDLNDVYVREEETQF